MSAAPTLAMSVLYFATGYLVWLLPGALSLPIASDLGLSASQIGLLVALPLLGGSVVRVPLGILVDRFGARRTALACQALTLVPLVWIWLGARTFGTLAGAGLLLGIAGGSFAVALPLASRWYPAERQGWVLGLVGSANAASGLGALAAPWIASRWGWPAGFGMAAAAAAAALLLFILLAREAPGRPTPKPLSSYFRVLRRGDLGCASLLYGFTFGGFVGISSFLPVVLHDQHGFGRGAAGAVTAAGVVAGSLARAVGGAMADRLGGGRVLGTVLVSASVGLAAIPICPEGGSAAVLMVLVLTLLGAGNGALFHFVPRLFGKDLGVATGMIGAAGGLGGFLLPPLLGVLREATGGYGTGLLLLSVAGMLAAAPLRRVASRPEPALEATRP